jgi:hypothetical protein
LVHVTPQSPSAQDHRGHAGGSQPGQSLGEKKEEADDSGFLNPVFRFLSCHRVTSTGGEILSRYFDSTELGASMSNERPQLLASAGPSISVSGGTVHDSEPPIPPIAALHAVIPDLDEKKNPDFARRLDRLDEHISRGR